MVPGWEDDRVHPNALHLPSLFDLLGIFTADASGALTAIRKGLDLLGVAVLAAVTALGGGVLRDLMIGATPPAVLTDWTYLTTATVAALSVLLAERGGWRAGPALPGRLPLSTVYLYVDAATLGCFAVSGAVKSLDYGLSPIPAALMVVVTAVGGGVVRDVLTNEVPVVLRRELYAVPALIGALVIVAAARYEPAETPLAFVAAAIAALVRIMAVRRGWHAQLPPTRGVAGPEAAQSAGTDRHGGSDQGTGV